MEKIDYKKQMKYLYEPTANEPVTVEVPEMHFLAIEGKGDPNTASEFKEGIETLFTLSYVIKFALKRSQSVVDYIVMPLEGFYDHDDILQDKEQVDGNYILRNKDEWRWSLQIRQPDLVTEELFEQARAEVAKKKKLPCLSKVRFETFQKGLSVQIMHIGPFSDERATMERLYAFIENNGYECFGRHHEIYLSDKRRTPPDKLKTVIRQPVKKK